MGADDDGSCGDNVAWQFSSSTKTLSIFGTGNMTDFSDSSVQPWESYSQIVTSVVIEEGVTSIGENAFSTFSHLTSVTLPPKCLQLELLLFVIAVV